MVRAPCFHYQWHRFSAGQRTKILHHAMWPCTEFVPTEAHMGASLVAQRIKNLLTMQETQVGSLGWEDALEKGTATHSSILAWRISGTEEPGRLQPMDCKESDMTEQLTHSD